MFDNFEILLGTFIKSKICPDKKKKKKYTIFQIYLYLSYTNLS